MVRSAAPLGAPDETGTSGAPSVSGRAEGKLKSSRAASGTIQCRRILHSNLEPHKTRVRVAGETGAPLTSTLTDCGGGVDSTAGIRCLRCPRRAPSCHPLAGSDDASLPNAVGGPRVFTSVDCSPGGLHPL